LVADLRWVPDTRTDWPLFVYVDIFDFGIPGTHMKWNLAFIRSI
jgi:hypothetical protein